MRICIIGGGKVGYYLSKTLLEHGHEPVVIEQDPKTAARVANDLDLPVIHGDGASLEALRAAEAEKCQAVVCVSGQDEINLVAAQLAKMEFNVARTVARVNNPKNAPILKALGVDIVVSATQNLTAIIEREVETQSIRTVSTLTGGAASVVELTLPKHFVFSGQTLAQIPVPAGCVVVLVIRGQDIVIPNGATALLEGDHVMLAATDEALQDLIKSWKIPK